MLTLYGVLEDQGDEAPADDTRKEAPQLQAA